jgi:dTDP-4-dehydrorhamnose reductase
MKILMTGSTGLVGSRLVSLLRQHEIIEFRWEDGLDVVDYSHVWQALEDTDVDAVVHLAAFTDVSAAYKQKGWWGGPCYQINVFGTQNIARACAKLGIYLVHISTDFVFNGEQLRPYTEEDTPEPLHDEWYGRTKYWAEEEVQRSGAEAAILRIAYPFLAHFPPKLDLVRWILKGLREGNLPPMVTDQIITPTFIDDLAPVIAHFADRRQSGTFHVVGSTWVSPYELAWNIAEVWDLDPYQVRLGCLADLLVAKDSRPRQRCLRLSSEKLPQLGIRTHDLKSALRMVKQQMREVGSGTD